MINDDIRKMKFDFLAEMGDLLVSAGDAVAGAASAERVDVLEMALRNARAILVDAICEFRALSNEGGADDE